jgi:hypothetical protein
MKKTLKLVLIFAGGLFALVFGSLAGFVLIDRNKTYYIYDVRFVEPVEGMSGYVYTDSEAEYVSIKNQSFYMSSDEKNFPYPCMADTLSLLRLLSWSRTHRIDSHTIRNGY